MCIFSGPVVDVKNTRIFARLTNPGRQVLVYQMQFSTNNDLAMILPIPVALPSRPDSVRFISLQNYPKFFDRMQTGFPELTEDNFIRMGIPIQDDRHLGFSRGAGEVRQKQLPVVVVGDYEATFVPTLADFSYIDERFKLSSAVWNDIPAYQDYGFAVFKLRKPKAPATGVGRRTDNKPHPMAFEFETRMSNSLFFPTVHIHDGKVHKEEQFDHQLYMQDHRLRSTHLSEVPNLIPTWLLRENLYVAPKASEPLRERSPEIFNSEPKGLPPVMSPTDLRRSIAKGRRLFLFWDYYRYEIRRNGFPLYKGVPQEAVLRKSIRPAAAFHDVAATEGCVAANEYCFTRTLNGIFTNSDVIISLAKA